MLDEFLLSLGSWHWESIMARSLSTAISGRVEKLYSGGSRVGLFRWEAVKFCQYWRGHSFRIGHWNLKDVELTGLNEGLYTEPTPTIPFSN